MKVEGNLSLVEGSHVDNLTMPSGTAFPTGTRGELFYLSEASGNNPVGVYIYTGSAWVVLSDVSMTSSGIVFTDMKEPTGFYDATETVISFVNATRTFSIAPVASSFTVYAKGVRHIKTVAESCTITNTEGNWYFYYDTTGTLQVTAIFPGNTLGVAIVASVYWDATNSTAIMFCDERHGMIMDGMTHSYLHNTVGTRYASGLSAGDYTLAGSGTNDGDCTISLTNGVVYDEDIRFNIEHGSGGTTQQFLSGTVTGLTGTPSSKALAKIPLFYRLGATGDIRKITATNAPVIKGANRAQFNKYATGTWSLAEPGAANYFAVWIGATNNINEPIVALLGQREDGTIVTAQTNNTPNAMAFGDFPFREFKYLYRLIYQASNSYTNSFGGRLRDVTDYREVSSLPGVATPSQDHGVLSGTTNSNSHPATAISTVTSAFDGVLTSAETNIQLALDKIDDHAHTGVYEPADANIQSHIGNTSNPHATTAAQVGAYTTGQIDTELALKVTKAGDIATNLQINSGRVRQGTDISLGTGTATIDYSTGDYFKITSTGNITIALSNLPETFVTSITLQCVNFGAYTITWPAGIKWAAGGAPALTTSGTDFVTIIKDKNEVLYGFLLGRDVR
jgi:hypothetical protein